MPSDAASLSLHADLTVVERRVLDRIFQHPISHNLAWREVTALFKTLGAVEQAHNGHLVFKLGTNQLTFAAAQAKDLAADDVMSLRHLLTQAGWHAAPIPAEPAAEAAIAIIIDHAGARIYELPLDEVHHAPKETHHLHHAIARRQHDADREEGFPADHRFFDAIAKDVPADARIIVVSHGTGQSNEGAHLMDYMAKHHRIVHDRIARVLVADLTHTSVPQQLRLARDALRDALRDAPGAPDAIAN